MAVLLKSGRTELAGDCFVHTVASVIDAVLNAADAGHYQSGLCHPLETEHFLPKMHRVNRSLNCVHCVL